MPQSWIIAVLSSSSKSGILHSLLTIWVKQYKDITLLPLSSTDSGPGLAAPGIFHVIFLFCTTDVQNRKITREIAGLDWPHVVVCDLRALLMQGLHAACSLATMLLLYACP